jgi:hypothetical protein
MKHTCTTLPISLDLTSADWARLASQAESFNSSCQSTKLTFTRISGVGVIPKVFEYKINVLDGRIWKQTITFDDLRNPAMTFNVNDLWRLTEFSQQRTLRDILVALVGSYPDLEKITYDFV